MNAAIQVWTTYANLTFTQAPPNDKSAAIRVAFDGNRGSWSAVGRDALNITGEQTMNLGWLSDTVTPSELDFGIILHEWGHALGLVYEWDSTHSTINVEAVIKFYSEEQWDADAARQHAVSYHEKSLSNLTKVDSTSIMTYVPTYTRILTHTITVYHRYFMPGSLSANNTLIPVNKQLSHHDKAFMIINYPGRMPDADMGKWTLLRALGILGFPSSFPRAFLMPLVCQT